ncbi:MAG TPA: CaiB/BaiF CoA-transferase family protein [Syntrophales bacterium]|nr:CaiB/BaiF CoA-transferase family protein [Syntrophales bacterium]
MAGPLKGLKILDFTTLLPGPYATMLLADLGAEVLRVVSPSRPDLTNLFPPFLPGRNISATAAYLWRGKRSISLNLKNSAAVPVVKRLVGTYDILIEQFRPGVMAKLGLGYEDLSQDHPALIYCSLTGYGQTGPLAGRAGHDINFLARSGLMSYSGRKESGPSLTGMQIADVAAGSSNAVIGILAAVIHRGRTGRGQHIDIAMTDGAFAFNAMAGAVALVDGKEPQREDGPVNGGSLYDFYETQDGQYLSVGAIEPQFFGAFCRAVGCPELSPGGFWPQNTEETKMLVRKIIRTKTRDEWVEIFADFDACVEPVLSFQEAANDPHTKARGLVADVDLAGGGTVRQIACPIRFSRTPPACGKAGEEPGAGTAAALREIGYPEEEIEALRKGGLFD